MIWLTWRQFRAQAIVAAAVLAIFAVVLLATGPHLASLYRGSGLAACSAHQDCTYLASKFLQPLANGLYRSLYVSGIAVLLCAPGIIGIFWGAPLIAHELERGTLRLAWNQSVTRGRWLATKLGLLALASMTAAGLLSLMLTWWAGPIDTAGRLAAGAGTFTFGQFTPAMFDVRGVVPVGYAAFAFVLGVLVGVLIRRTVPAMAITLGIFAAVQIVMPVWIRPHLIAPVHLTRALNPEQLTILSTSSSGQINVVGSMNVPGAWLLSNQTLTPAGQVYTGPSPRPCVSQTGSMQACTDALGRLHLRQFVTYQPASRYWDFQWLELGIFIALAVLLTGSVFWLVRRRLS